jgi:hypothetical protein
MGQNQDREKYCEANFGSKELSYQDIFSERCGDPAST